MTRRANLHALVVVRGASADRPSVGVEMRRHHLLRAAGRVATLDVFVTSQIDDKALEQMSTAYGARVGCVRSAVIPPSRAGRLVRFLRHASSPARVAREDWPALRRDLRSWMADYQLIMVELIDDFLMLGQMLPAPIVVDHDDRESEIMRQLRSLSNAGSAQSRPRELAHDLYLRIEQFRWQCAERSVMRQADSFLVACEEDALSLGNPVKAVVVPNGFELAGAPVGSREVKAPPTIAFWGIMSYGPNRDGAQWLLDDVLPRLRRLIPNVRVVIIGSGSGRVRVPQDGSVVVTGFVQDLSVWLSQTDVAVVPLRVGGGTRIKIIEAWANNIPVVSTSRGAYGLGAVNGENILLADDPEAFARSVALTLEDVSVRDRLIEKGAVRANTLSWSKIEMDLGEHLMRVARTSPSNAT